MSTQRQPNHPKGRSMQVQAYSQSSLQETELPCMQKGMHGIWMGKKSERALLKVEIPQAPWVPHRQGASDIGSHIG